MFCRKIVIEGIDGSGKETQLKKILKHLKEKNQEFEVMEYPDKKGPFWGVIRGFLNYGSELDYKTQFLLFSSDVTKDVKNLLGKRVLFKRYFTTALAYQCTLGFPIERALEFAKTFDIPKPDLIIYLKVSAESAVKRKINQKNVLDRFESKEVVLKKITEAYDKLAEKNVFGKWVVIDGEKKPNEVFEEIKKHL